MGDGIKIGAAALLLALTAGQALAAPVPGKLETYRDWTIGCDNIGRCEAVSLMPEDNTSDGRVMMRIARDAGPSGEVIVWLETDNDKLSGTATFTVDGRRIATAPLSKASAKVAGPQAAALAVAMARGTRLEVRLGTTLLGAPSLTGSTAALRYIDAQQGRAGTTTALIATGPLGAQAVKAAPAMPLVRGATPPIGVKPAELWADERSRAVKMSGCTEDHDPAQPIELQALSHNQTLLLVPCGAGAYNFMSMPLIATGAAGRRTLAKASFDYEPHFAAPESHFILVNAGWDEKTGRLSSFAKGRGLGDCGNSEDYVWDGTIFRLVEATAMGECRGVSDWITVWRARVDPRR